MPHLLAWHSFFFKVTFKSQPGLTLAGQSGLAGVEKADCLSVGVYGWVRGGRGLWGRVPGGASGGGD